MSGRAIAALVGGIDSRLEPQFNNMTKASWVLESVGDKSEYVYRMTEVLVQYSDKISVLNEDFYLTYLTKLAE